MSIATAPTPETPPAWLAGCLLRHPDDYPDRAWQAQPHVVTLAGEAWTMASDGAMALAEPGVRWGAGPIPAPIAKFAAKVLAAPPVYTHAITVAGLSAFAGPPRPDVTCTECDGSGTCAHHCDCHLCHVQTEACTTCVGGLMPPPPAYFRAGELAFDAVLLARALEGLPGASATALVRGGFVPMASSCPQPPGAAALALDLPERRIRLMCVRSAHAAAPVLPWNPL